MPKSKSLTERIRHFTPSWFAVTMGVGVQISLFHLFPFPGSVGGQTALDIIATGFLIANMIIFAVMTAMTVARYVKYPQIWSIMIHHPVQSMFVGAFPMGFATIVNGLVIEAYTRWRVAGSGFLYFVWGLWWLDAALSLLSCFGMIYIMITRHQHELQTASAVWLLPIVPTLVCGTSGTIVAGALKHVNPNDALLTTYVACTLFCIGLSISMVVLAVYALRLVVHGFPAGGLIVSIFVPLGPLGQGGYGIILAGDLLAELLPTYASTSSYIAGGPVPGIIQAITFVTAYGLWAFGFFFIIPALVALANIRKIPVGLPWWGLIFPTGVYTLLTIELATKLDSMVFRVLGTFYTIAIFALFGITSFRTVALIRYGSIFHAPCLDDYPIPSPTSEVQTQVDVDADGVEVELTDLPTPPEPSAPKDGSIRRRDYAP